MSYKCALCRPTTYLTWWCHIHESRDWHLRDGPIFWSRSFNKGTNMRSVSYLRCAYIQRVTRIDIVISITPQDSSFYVCSHKSVDRINVFHLSILIQHLLIAMVIWESMKMHFIVPNITINYDKTWCLTLIVITYHVVKYSKLLWNIIM